MNDPECHSNPGGVVGEILLVRRSYIPGLESTPGGNGEASGRIGYTCKEEKVPMRDGVELAADLYTPESEGPLVASEKSSS